MGTDMAKEQAYRAYKQGYLTRGHVIDIIPEDELAAVEEYDEHSREPDEVRLYV